MSPGAGAYPFVQPCACCRADRGEVAVHHDHRTVPGVALAAEATQQSEQVGRTSAAQGGGGEDAQLPLHSTLRLIFCLAQRNTPTHLGWCACSLTLAPLPACVWAPMCAGCTRQYQQCLTVAAGCDNSQRVCKVAPTLNHAGLAHTHMWSASHVLCITSMQSFRYDRSWLQRFPRDLLISFNC